MSNTNAEKWNLYRAAAAMTVVISVGFIVFGIIIQNWPVVAMFTVLCIAGLTKPQPRS